MYIVVGDMNKEKIDICQYTLIWVVVLKDVIDRERTGIREMKLCKSSITIITIQYGEMLLYPKH